MSKGKSGKTRKLLLRLDEDIDEFLRELFFHRRTSKNALGVEHWLNITR